MGLKKSVLIMVVFIFQSTLLFADVTWIPTAPTKYDSIKITVTNCTVGAKLHWGVNGWKRPISVYWPPNSTLWNDSAAIESPMQGPANGTCTITIGPFENAAQPVAEINFVIHFNDGSWDNNSEQNYKISLMSGDILWSPKTPGPNDTITVHIGNVTKSGNLHWGVNATNHNWTQPISAYWPPGTFLWSDGTAVETPLPAPDANSVSQIQLGPFNRGEQLVQSVDFVLHWADNSWDNNNGNDYHIRFSFTPKSEDPDIGWTSLQENDVLSGTVQLSVNATNTDTVEYWYNGHLIARTTVPFEYSWNTDGVPFGKLTLYARGINGAGRVQFAPLHVWKLPEIVQADAPPGTQPGINYNADGSVTLALLAPYKKFVLIRGDFNNWNASETVMNMQQDGLWWKTLNLSPGTYKYQYVVNGTLILADPFSPDVDWTINGHEDWHPENAKTVLRVPKPQFNWTDGDYVTPAKADFVIYEVHIGDFSPSGKIQGLIDKLGYIKDLGITAIELMPNYEFPGGRSWGYNPSFYMAPESSYGTPDDFKRLVNEAHKIGIAVLMDMVYNHSDATCPLYQLYGTDYAQSPYYHAVSNPWGFPDFDHYKPATQRFVDRVNKYWMDDYHVDGFRFDYTRGYDETSEAGNLNLLNRMATVAHINKPAAYLIAEHLPQDPAVATKTQMDAEWHDTFHDQMKANLREGQFEGNFYGNLAVTARAVDYSLDGFTKTTQVINYLESHDEQRIIWEVQTNPAIGYDLALQKSRLGAAVLFTAAGTPMMYMGEEFGMDTKKTLDWNKLKWNYLTQPKTKALYEYYKKIIQFRDNHEALRKGSIQILKKFISQKTIVYERKWNEQKIIVAANFSRAAQTVDIPLDGMEHWYEFLTDSDEGTADTLKSFNLPGSSARIFTNFRDWPTKVMDHSESGTFPKSTELAQNYPNPFNGFTQISFSVGSNDIKTAGSGARVTVTLYDLLGREVQILFQRDARPGNYRVTWNGTNRTGTAVPSGLYIYKLTIEGHSAKREWLKKLMYLK